jgi:ABC-type phosphate/phosphonate transport system substrate-binding protein
MIRDNRVGLWTAALGVTLGAVLAAVGSGEERSAPAKSVRIGMVGTLFRDIPEPMIRVLMQPFSALMETQTGMSGELVRVENADKLGRKLADNQVELGVFHGFEFAWARQQHPDLQPLMIAVNQHQHLRAILLVRKDGGAARFADLRGKSLALGRGTREHCRLFLDRQCQQQGQPPAQFFGQVTTPADLEDAVDDVVDNFVQATVVDGVFLECYQRRKPGRFAQLKVLDRSDVFPAAVIAYHPGALDDDVLQRFRTGMLNASDSALGRQLLTLWKLTGFEPVPADYEQTLKAIAKAYPAPAAKKPK